MRISDWSSDVCSSDLRDVIGFGERVGDYLPVGVKVRDVKDRLFGINIGYSAIALAEVAEKFGKAYFRPRLEIYEDPPVPDLRRDRRSAEEALVDAEEVALVGHPGKRAIVPIGQVMIAA